MIQYVLVVTIFLLRCAHLKKFRIMLETMRMRTKKWWIQTMMATMTKMQMSKCISVVCPVRRLTLLSLLGILMTRTLLTKSAVQQPSYWRASLGHALID
jgi:hypothetical protein